MSIRRNDESLTTAAFAGTAGGGISRMTLSTLSLKDSFFSIVAGFASTGSSCLGGGLARDFAAALGDTFVGAASPLEADFDDALEGALLADLAVAPEGGLLPWLPPSILAGGAFGEVAPFSSRFEVTVAVSVGAAVSLRASRSGGALRLRPGAEELDAAAGPAKRDVGS